MTDSVARSEFRIRPIQPTDDPAVAQLIRTVMPEFGACGSGFAIEDPQVDCMHATYSEGRAGYWIVERAGRVVGGAGFAPLRSGDPATCELQKMYFLPETRGLGLGRQLLELCLDRARAVGYARCYLETIEAMKAAQRLYVAAGFQRISAPLGDTGHFACDTFYLRTL